MIIKVPVSAYLFKAVSIFFTDGVIAYDRKEKLSLTLNAFFRKPNYGESYKPHYINPPFIQVELSPKNIKEGKIYLSKEVVAEVEEIMLATFNEETNQLIDKLMLAGFKQKKAIQTVYKTLRMSEEKITFEALLKRYQRYCEDKALTASKVRSQF